MGLKSIGNKDIKEAPLKKQVLVRISAAEDYDIVLATHYVKKDGDQQTHVWSFCPDVPGLYIEYDFTDFYKWYEVPELD